MTDADDGLTFDEFNDFVPPDGPTQKLACVPPEWGRDQWRKDR